jgi:DNA end-binding protein Ku
VASRPIWRGAISFGMVSIPVGIYTAVSEKDLHFNQIHEKCGSRIKQQKFCPVCDRVVTSEELQRGYEVSKGAYVIVDEKDFEELPVPSKHTITVDRFVDSTEIAPTYFDSSYYLQPEEAGRKPYALLLAALKEKKMSAVAKIALRNKESLCLLMLNGDQILLETLFFPDEIREPEDLKLEHVKVEDKELKMALSLIDMLSGDFNPEEYQDEYREALMQRIEAKLQGQQITEAPAAPEARVIDLFDALKASLEAAKKEPKEAKESKESKPSKRKSG